MNFNRFALYLRILKKQFVSIRKKDVLEQEYPDWKSGKNYGKTTENLQKTNKKISLFFSKNKTSETPSGRARKPNHNRTISQEKRREYKRKNRNRKKKKDKTAVAVAG